MAGAATDGPLDASWLKLDTKMSSKCVGMGVDLAPWTQCNPLSTGGSCTEAAMPSVIPCEVQIVRFTWVDTERRTIG